MRYIELTESQPIGQTFYHVTTNNRVKSIMADGLEPGRHRRWKNSFGATLGDRGFIYLISNFTEAVRFAARQDYQHRITKKAAKTVILCIQNVPTDKLVLDDHIESQFAGNTWFKLPDVIPPHDIVRVIPLSPELTKQLVNGGTVQGA